MRRNMHDFPRNSNRSENREFVLIERNQIIQLTKQRNFWKLNAIQYLFRKLQQKFNRPVFIMLITRYPPTENNSLRAWSAADEYLLKEVQQNSLDKKAVAIFNDRFGYLGCHLHKCNPWHVSDFKSQQISLELNLKRNGVNVESGKFINPLDSLPELIDIAILSIPKSLDLYRFYLNQISRSMAENGIALCGFMTRHFTPQLLSIAEEYFHDVSQSLAWKKARVLTLKEKKESPAYDAVEEIPFTFSDGGNESLKQYPGVFSSGNVDYATQFLLGNLTVQPDENCILDLASGNGVIARAVQLQKPDTEIHLLDDSYLAIASSKLNLSTGNVHFHWGDSLDEIDDTEFDIVVSNPPFHFEHEVNTEISTALFREVAGRLKPGGRFVCVANKHLGYLPILKKFFTRASIIKENRKFVIYECKKGGK